MADTKAQAEVRAKLKAFFKAWKARDYDTMLSHCQKTYQHTNPRPEHLKAQLPQELSKYRIKAIRCTTSVVFDVKVSLHHPTGVRPVNVRLLKEIAPYKPRIVGEWGVNPISIRSI